LSMVRKVNSHVIRPMVQKIVARARKFAIFKRDQGGTDFLRRDIPTCDIPSLLRQLRYTLLEHQFQTGALRNEAQPIRDHRPSYARPRWPT
jgi:hypothetical protein